MASLQVWAVYNKKTGRVDLSKGKRAAMRIAVTYNKLFKLLSSFEYVTCQLADDFFNSHHINKEDIYFSWLVSPLVKMKILKQFFKMQSKSNVK